MANKLTAGQKLLAMNIQTLVAHAYALTVEQLVGPSRESHLIWPRYLAMELVRQAVATRTANIAGMFNRHASTICHARDKVAQWRSIYPQLDRDFDKLMKRVKILIHA